MLTSYRSKVVKTAGAVVGLMGGTARSCSLSLSLRAAVLCVLVVPAAGVAFAQVSTAAFHGTVTDSTGAAVPGALIVVTQTETNYSKETTSTANGTFDISSLPVGTYNVQVKKDQFGGFEQNGVVLEVGQTVTLSLPLKVGGVSETVIVSSATPAVETTSPVQQTVVEQQTIQGLALNGRNPASLVFIAPGVTDSTLNQGTVTIGSTVKTASANLSAQIAPTINGVAPGGTYFSLDGAGNTDPFNVIGGPFPNPDATQEFGVVTASYGARYVSAPGGAVNVVTQSGSNQIHGSVFEFIRNGAVNATQYYVPAKDVLKRNQYGFAVGGPLMKDRLFGFASLQQTVVRSQQGIDVLVGSAAQRAGQFIQTSTGKTVTIPVSTVAANLLKYVPAATRSDGHFIGVTPLSSTEPQGTVKLDYNLGSQRIFARYFTDQVALKAQPMTNNNLLLSTPGMTQSWSNYTLGDTFASKSGRWVLDGRASFIHVKSTTLSDPSTAVLDGAALGEKVTPAIHPTLGTFYAGGFFITGAVPQRFPRDSWDYNVDVFHTANKHQFAFGTNLRFVSLHEASENGQEPGYAFFGVYSRITYGGLDANSFADFIAGHPIVGGQSNGTYSDIKGKLFGFYSEDKYSATERLTLTGGLRWDPYKPFVTTNNQIDCWRPGQKSTVYTNAPVGLVYPGDPNCNSGGTSGKYGLVQPRIGFAYKLDQQGNTAIRGGFGLYSGQAQLQSFVGFAAPPFNLGFQFQNPFQSDADIFGSNGVANPFAGGFPGAGYVPPANATFPAGANVSAIDPNYRPAYTEEWSLSLQHAFTQADSMELNYVGTQSIHVAQTYDDNLPIYNSTATVGNEQSRRPYTALGQIRTLRSNATGNYHGLSTTFRHQRGGLNFYGGFNWSKCLDDGSSPASTFATTANGNNPALRRGRCDYDQNLTFRSTVVWNTPKLGSANSFVRAAAGSWLVSGLVVADAGQPYSILDNSDGSETGNGLDLADVVPGVPVRLANGNLNINAFKDPAPGTYGNSGRNTFRSPNYVDIDPAVMKTFPFPKEHFNFVLRFEAFNVLNHTNKTIPGNQLTTGPTIFGTFNGARAPRILQAAAKFTF